MHIVNTFTVRFSYTLYNTSETSNHPHDITSRNHNIKLFLIDQEPRINGSPIV